MFKTHLNITKAFQSRECNTPCCLLLFLHSTITLELRRKQLGTSVEKVEEVESRTQQKKEGTLFPG